MVRVTFADLVRFDPEDTREWVEAHRQAVNPK